MHISNYHPSQAKSNPFFPRKKSPISWLRVFFLVIVAFIVSVTVLIFGTKIFHFRYILVDGTRAIYPSVVESRIQTLMNEKAFMFFRKNNFLLFSAKNAENAIRTSLLSDNRFESSTVKEEWPFVLRVHVVERVPNIIYLNGGQEYLVDRKGMITAVATDSQTKKKEYPSILDQTTGLFAVGDRALSEATVTFLFDVRNILQTSEIPIHFYFLPPVSCLNINDTLEQPLETIGTPQTNSSQQENTNSQPTNSTNTNTSKKADEIITLHQADTSGGVEECDLRTLALQSQELRAKTVGGWEIFFRVTDKAQTQVARLLRVLREQKINQQSLHYVDLRFGDQVIYK